MDIILTNIYLFVLALVLAALEIQIEGKYGWAHKLPTWRPNENRMFTKIYKKIMGGREATGYHMLMFGFVFLILHMPYFFSLSWTWGNYLKTLSIFFIFIVLWDFLWFVMNPYHPLKKFNKDHIWWHKKWLLGAPLDYYLSVLISFLILLPLNDKLVLNWWAWHMFLFAVQVFLLVLFTLYILKIDNWKSGK